MYSTTDWYIYLCISVRQLWWIKVIFTNVQIVFYMCGNIYLVCKYDCWAGKVYAQSNHVWFYSEYLCVEFWAGHCYAQLTVFLSPIFVIPGDEIWSLNVSEAELSQHNYIFHLYGCVLLCAPRFRFLQNEIQVWFARHQTAILSGKAQNTEALGKNTTGNSSVQTDKIV